MNQFQRNLKMAIDVLGIKQTDLAHKVGCDISTITNYKQGKSKPRGNKQIRIAEALGISREKLMNEVLKPTDLKADAAVILPAKSRAEVDISSMRPTGTTNRIPIMNIEVMAGDFVRNFTKEDIIGEISFPWLQAPSGCFGVKVSGDSMEHPGNPEKSISEDDILIVQKAGFQFKKDHVYVFVSNDNEALVKYVDKVDNEVGELHLGSFNPSYDTRVLRLEELHAIYGIHGILKWTNGLMLKE